MENGVLKLKFKNTHHANSGMCSSFSSFNTPITTLSKRSPVGSFEIKFQGPQKNMELAVVVESISSVTTQEDEEKKNCHDDVFKNYI